MEIRPLTPSEYLFKKTTIKRQASLGLLKKKPQLAHPTLQRDTLSSDIVGQKNNMKDDTRCIEILLVLGVENPYAPRWSSEEV